MAKQKAKKSVVSKVKEKLSKTIETTDANEFAELMKKGYTVVEIRSERKGNYQGPTIPKTYVLKK